MRGLGMEQPAGQTSEATVLRACFSAFDRNHRSFLGLEPVDRGAARQGMGRICSARAHTRPGLSLLIHSESTRCAQACDAVAALAFPSAKYLVIAAVSLPVQSTAQGEHP